MSFGPASILGVERFDSDLPLELLPGDSEANKEQLIQAPTAKCWATPM